jgi:hypothetical protein
VVDEADGHVWSDPWEYGIRVPLDAENVEDFDFVAVPLKVLRLLCQEASGRF